ncbi:MAG: hypothetical protein HRT36_00325 [Alphaproteobacteria bacterium]|nr:hypothetical protein [Alphaproteobacteria bacterium]
MAIELTGATQPVQQNSPTTSMSPASIGNTGVISKTPDSAVTQAAKPDQADVHKDDAHRREATGAVSLRRNAMGVPRLEEMARSGVRTVVGFDVSEAKHIYIRIQDINSGVEIAQIPSKEFVQFLRQRFEELSGTHNPQNTLQPRSSWS